MDYTTAKNNIMLHIYSVYIPITFPSFIRIHHTAHVPNSLVQLPQEVSHIAHLSVDIIRKNKPI